LRLAGRTIGISRGELGVLAGLAVWGLAPVVLMAVHAQRAGLQLTGADGPIGADQLQYLAWARSAGEHGLAANLFDLAPATHVFAQPLFSLTGFLWRLGLPLQVAYLLWKPVAVIVLFAGALMWSRRFFGTLPGRRLAALGLSLFFFTPFAWLAAWASLGSPTTRGNLLQVAGELFPAGELWGYLPSAVAVALVPLSLLAVERGLSRDGERPARTALTIGAVAALLASWLHPWQGVVLLLILGGLMLWGERRDWPRLAIPVAAAALPLLYYLLLSRLDSAWELAARNELVPRLPIVVLLVGLGPPLLIAALGMRRPTPELAERGLHLWIPASLVTYFVLGSFPSHALESISLPLAVLAVRGWSSLKLPRVAGPLAVLAVTVPGMAYEVRAFRNVARSPVQEYYLTASEARALNWVAGHAPPGGVLAPTLFAILVPSQTGRAVWVGHEFWSRDYRFRARAAEALFDGTLSASQARALVLASGARLLISDCAHRLDLEPLLGPIVAAPQRFGCATVYEVRPAR
jgi:hypothetical protein